MSRDFFSTSSFFHESVSPKPLSIPLRPFRIFFSSRCTTSVVDTGGKWKKSSIRKICIISYIWTPLGSGVVIQKIFFFKFILRCQQSDNWSHCQQPASQTLVGNLPPVSLTPRYQQHQRNWWQNLPTASLIPVANLHLDLQISPRIFEKI